MFIDVPAALPSDQSKGDIKWCPNYPDILSHLHPSEKKKEQLLKQTVLFLLPVDQ